MTLNVIDIGRDQNGLDLNSVPHDAVIVAASDGGVVNPYFHQQYGQARLRDDPRGAYHFFRGDPAVEAAFFLNNAAEAPGDGVLICDAETRLPNLPWLVRDWCDRVRAATGITPGIYTMWSFMFGAGAYDWSPCIDAGYWGWEAQYPTNALNAGYGPLSPPPATVWPELTMWQYSSTGRLQGWGGNLDLSVFYHDRAAWDALATGSTVEGGGIATIHTPDEQFFLDLNIPLP